MNVTTLIKLHQYCLENGFRFGQTIWNLMAVRDGWEVPKTDPSFFISDEELEEKIKSFIK